MHVLKTLVFKTHILKQLIQIGPRIYHVNYKAKKINEAFGSSPSCSPKFMMITLVKIITQFGIH